MAYHHILVAVDLSPESQLLVHKAVALARAWESELFLIHVDINYSEIYSSLVEAEFRHEQEAIAQETQQNLNLLVDKAGYPIREIINGKGDLVQALDEAIHQYGIDLVVCGHHQDFWNTLKSPARQLIHRLHVDMLIVPLREEDEEFSGMSLF
ncbi:MAG TPA: universal stress global response regulator UspA [Franconibacter pulveris]|nr:universal stress global response regulator UspA [Franconibacter pulveris]